MKSVLVLGSRKFFTEIDDIVTSLNAQGIKSETVDKSENAENDTLESVKSALMKSFTSIEKYDLVYIVAPGGYIGKAVAIEISYAYSKGKDILSSEQIKELSAQGLISQVIPSDQLFNYL